MKILEYKLEGLPKKIMWINGTFQYVVHPYIFSIEMVREDFLSEIDRDSLSKGHLSLAIPEGQYITLEVIRAIVSWIKTSKG